MKSFARGIISGLSMIAPIGVGAISLEFLALAIDHHSWIYGTVCALGIACSTYCWEASR